MRITTFKRRPKLLLAGLLLLSVSATGSAAITDTYSASYDVSRGPLPLGQVTFRLEPGKRPGCYIYTGRADANAIVNLFIGDISDVSRFCITDDGALRSQFFRHHEDGNPEDSYTLTFDWADGTVRYQSRAGRTKIMTLPENATDPLSIHFAVRLWLARAGNPATLPDRGFTLVEENEIETYSLSVSDGGRLETPGGRYDTVQVAYVDDNDVLRFWLARDAEWIPVRMAYETEGGSIIEMHLARVSG